MNIEWLLQRKPTKADWMFGDLDCAGRFRCKTLEDELREHKVAGETAINSGRYELVKEFSPKFKKDLLTLLDVSNFVAVRVHSVKTDDDTEGCIGVGGRADEEKGELYGGLAEGVRARLEEIWQQESDAGNRIWLTIRNAPGDHYVDTGNAVGV